jgi:hypothetical protein
VAALNLLRLGRLTGNIELEKKADQMFQTFAQQVMTFPKVHAQFLNAVDFMVGPSREIVIAGDLSLEATRAMVAVVHKLFLPNKVILLRPSGSEVQELSALAPFVSMLETVWSQPTAYVCEQYACKTPITDAAALESALQ